MPRALTRKTVADLRSRPLQSALLALVMLMAAAMLTLAVTLRERASDPFDGVMKVSNGAHAWFYGSDRDSITRIAEQPGVVGVSGPFSRLQARTNGDGDTNISLWGMTTELPEVGHPVMKSGRWLQGPNEIVLEAGYARARHLVPGATVEIVTPRGATTMTVAGTALMAARAPYPMNSPGQAWVLEEVVESAASGAPAWEMGVKLQHPGSAAAFITRALGDPSTPGPQRFANDWESIRTDIADRSEVSAIFFLVFGGFAAAAVALIVANVVSSSVLANLREVGLLKAVGFTPAQVTATFLASYVLLAAGAGLAGGVMGSLLAPWLVAGDSAGVLTVPRGVEVDPGVILPVAAGICALVFVCTLFPAWRAGRVSAISAIAGQRRAATAPSRLATAGRALHLPAVVVLGLKDVFARPVRACFTVLAIAIAIGTTVMALMIEATFAEAKDDPSMFSNEAFHIDVTASGRAEAERVLALGSADAAVRQAATNLQMFGTVPGRVRPFLIDAYGGDREGVLPRAIKGRQPAAVGEVMLAEQLVETLHARPGDTITIQLQTFEGPGLGSVRTLGEVTFAVVGVFAEADDDGQVLATWRESVERFATPNMQEVVGFNLKDTREATSFVGMLETTLGPAFRVHDEVKVNREAMEENAGAGRPVLIPLVTLLVVIAVVNVLTTLLFAVRERYRDIGILKAVGLSPREVVAMVAVGGAALALIAAAIGVPGGIWVTESLFTYFGRGEGWKESVGVTPPWWQLALLAPFALALAAAGAVIPARRAARMPVADALRFE